MVRQVRQIRLYIVVFLFGWILQGCGGPTDSTSTPAVQSTTLMIYMVGSDLESGRGAAKGTAGQPSAATRNIQEMLAASFTGVNVVLTTGGALKDDPDNLGLVKSWRTLKRHVIANGKMVELADLGAVSMAETDTLSNFIQWAKTSYPADRYMIVFWDHGAGQFGFGGDENFKGKAMSIPQMASAMKTAQQAVGISFDFIGYDACLMATAEVAYALSPYAKYLGASQELEPGSGWDWTAVINALSQKPSLDSLQFGKALADSFIAKQTREGDAIRAQHGAKYAEDRYNTFSISDLSKIRPLVDALASLGAGLSTEVIAPGGWLKIAERRARAMSFGGTATEDTDTLDLVDIYQFAQRLREVNLVPNEAVALQAALRDAVAYRKTGDLATTSANGLSVYFPSRAAKTSALNTLTKYYEPMQFPDAYKSLLKSYAQQAGVLPSIINISSPIIAANVMQSNITSALGLKEVHVILSAAGGGNTPGKIIVDGIMAADSISSFGGAVVDLSAGWMKLRGHPFAIVSSEHELTETGALLAFRHVVPILRNGVPTSLEVRQSGPGGNVWSVIGSWEGLSAEGIAARAGDAILPTDQITLLRVEVDIATEQAHVTARPMATFLAGDMQIERSPLPSGSYELRFVATDFDEQDDLSGAVAYNR